MSNDALTYWKNILLAGDDQTATAGEFDEQILADLIAQGVSEEELPAAFAAMRQKIRPAVEALLAEARQVALQGADGFSDFEDIFGGEDA